MTAILHRGAPPDPTDERTLGSGLWVVVVALVAALVGFSAAASLRSGPPGDGSPDAGFARDMAVHHAQAIEMGEAIRFRTADPAIRTLATDIVLTQQAQIGQMAGWLETWGLPATGRRPAMAWMGHDSGSMPGMATRAEVAALGQAPVAEAEGLFLQAMIRHHQGGMIMAEGLLARSQHRVVRRLAEKIVAAQQSEIQTMTDLLHDRGGAAPPATTTSGGDRPAHTGS